MILDDDNVKKLSMMDSQIVINTYNLISTSVPELKTVKESLFITSGQIQEQITYFDECILMTLCEFTYIPLWYLYSELKNIDSYSNPIEKIKNWKDLNLIFIDQQTIGEFLRPTNYLYQLFQMKKKKYEVIPFNMLSHTMSKIDIYLKTITGLDSQITDVLEEEFKGGKLDLLKIEPPDVLNVKKKLNNNVLNLLEGEKLHKKSIHDESKCLKIIDEKDIKISKNNTSKISEIENKIRTQIKQGIRDTSEFKNSSFFFCAVVDGKDYILQFPDLIIPIRRSKNCKPNSIAIEMELTAKSLSNYERNLKKYKNSLKFGSVVWFCGDNRVKKNLTQAFKNIGGTGFTSMYIFDYSPPKRKEINI